jgi:lysozyme
MMFRRFAAFLAVLLTLVLVACGQGTTHTVSVSTLEPRITYIPPTSSVTPEGAMSAQRPELLTPTIHRQLTIDSTGLHLIEGFEGYQRCAYWDPYGRVWTAGFGQTKGVYGGFCFPVVHGDKGVTAATANLKRSVQSEYEWAVHAIGYPFKQHEIDALDSFAYNLGAGIFTGSLGSDLASGHMYAASRIMLAYDHAGGIVLAGLRTRRAAEVRLLLTPVAKPAGPTRAQIRRELARDYRYRAHLRNVLIRQHCRVANPSRHCRGVLESGARANRSIAHIHHKYHVY